MNGIKTLPTIEFSQWFSWKDRFEIPEKDLPGIYLLARHEDRNPQKGKADQVDPHIVYVGETKKSLSTRWADFHREAFGEGGSHSGGTPYRKKQYANAEGALYLAAMPSSPLRWRPWANTSETELTATLPISLEELRYLKRSLELAPAKRKGPLNGAWIKFVERKVLLNFVLRWGKLPDCNKE
jgi:hypothetical protein